MVKHTILWAAVAGLVLALGGTANAGMLWYSTANNVNIDLVTSWNSQTGGGGVSPTAMPTAPGDTDIWVIQKGHRIKVAPADGTFYGGTIQIDISGTNDGELLAWRRNFTVQDVVLNGGAINSGDTDGKKITGGTLTLNSGIIGVEMASLAKTVQYAFGTYTGDGDIVVQPRNNGAPGTTSYYGGLRFVDGGDFSTFTGSFDIWLGATLGFGYNITTGTFDLKIDGTAGTNRARFELVNNVTVTSLTLGTESIAPGTYSFADFTGDQQAFFKDSGGTITVVPEPATMALMGLGGLGLILGRKRK